MQGFLLDGSEHALSSSPTCVLVKTVIKKKL